MQNNREVIIFAELFDGRLHNSVPELCALARGLADQLSGVASAILIGTEVKGFASELISYGMDKVYAADDARLRDYQPEAYTAVIEQVCRRESPEVLLFGQTLRGRDLGPRLAFRLKTGIAADCVEFAIDPVSKKLLATRPVYGAKALATLTFLTQPAIATLRSKAVSPAEKNEARTGQTVPLDVNIDFAKLRIKYIERVKQESEGPKLEDAKVIVSGGRGLGQAENFKLLEALAKILGGVVCGSRGAVDNGWLPSTRQVGLTGTIVSPRLYFAIGISGATQHMAGCASSQYIVAINKDPEAPIFRRAHYGVVADYKPVVTAMIQCCSQ
jgi:electron transfer flavoprotein alpha subunit